MKEERERERGGGREREGGIEVGRYYLICII